MLTYTLPHAELKQLGLEKNTLVIFMSDNGPHREGGANPGIWMHEDGPPTDSILYHNVNIQFSRTKKWRGNL